MVDTTNMDDNLSEWSDRFCGLVKTEDLAYIIYKAPAEELELLGTATRRKSLPVPARLRENEFANYIWKQKCTETLDYLLFAKACEPHVVATDSWKTGPRDKDAMQQLIAEGQKQFKRTRSAYIRLRYAYQIIRLAHYAGLYERTLELYDELIPQVDKKASHWEESIIPWWILGHKAGALRKLGGNVEASYYYALIFQRCPGRRASAYQSFFIRTDQEWEDCLRMCKSDTERATLYAIRAAGAESMAVEEMGKIYELDPQNEHLETLLVQEVRKMERNLLGLGFNDHREQNKRYYNLPRPYAGKYVISLQKFVRRCREEGKVTRPEIWQLAEGYLEFLAGDYYAADKTYTELGKVVDNKLLKEQLDVFRLALKIAALEKPDTPTEDFATELIKDDKLYKQYGSFPDFLKDKMQALYTKYQQNGKAFLCEYKVSDLKPNPQLVMVDDLLAVSLKEDKSSFERLLMHNYPTNDLLNIKATMLMSQGQFEAALETFRRIPAGSWNDYGQYDPFKETFKDCVNCHQRSDSLLSLYNKGELLETLLELEFKAKADIEGAARHYYKLGLVYYNMSYFGYEWKAMDFFRSGSTWAKLHLGKDGVYDYWKYPIGNKENTDLSRALYAFEKSRLLATDPELAAKAAYQAARCEQKIYFMTNQYKPEPCCNRIPRLPETYLVNLDRLKEQYRGTEFYSRAIQECKYFAVYARK